MKITGFTWLDDIVEKIAVRHHVEQDEVRELFANRPQFRRVERGHRPDEHVYSAAGQTDAGRYLVVYFVYKRNRRALVLSARDMTRAERRKYERG
ncbi:MAG: BrnT family toxin [Anaerolineae bacterium]